MIVGEFSLAVADDIQETSAFVPLSAHVDWYKKWFAAQILAYEKQAGCILWSWKTNWIGGKEDWRWSYEGMDLKCPWWSDDLKGYACALADRECSSC